jgi:hypothetical protein
VNPVIAVIIIVAVVAVLVVVVMRGIGMKRRDPSRGHVMENMPEGKGKAKMSPMMKTNNP